jgi:hypothetical protein
MAEGGFLPWKVQKIRQTHPVVRYDSLRLPMPPPPKGLQWQYNPASAEKWTLVESQTDGEVGRIVRKFCTRTAAELK